MDRIRQALGDAKLNYLGFSYGTFLGATYADVFPTHIRAMVLDGAENPELGAVAFSDTQAASVDAELGDFFDWCATSSSGCKWNPAGGRPAMMGAVNALVAQARQHPLPAQATSRTVGSTQVLFGVAEALYEPQTWPALGRALAEASGGDGTGLLAFFDAYESRSSNGQYANLLEAYDAVTCADQPWPSSRPDRGRRPRRGEGGAVVRPDRSVQRLALLGVAGPGHRLPARHRRAGLPAHRGGGQHR